MQVVGVERRVKATIWIFANSEIHAKAAPATIKPAPNLYWGDSKNNVSFANVGGDLKRAINAFRTLQSVCLFLLFS